MKPELLEFHDFVIKLNEVSSRYLGSMKELQEPIEEDVQFLFECFHSQ